MSSLPEEMHLEIDSRLPVKTVLRFKSLCKTCCNHFGEPSFIKMHRDHAIRKNFTFIMLHYEIGFGKSNPMYSVEYNSLSSKLSSGTHNPLSEAVEMDYPVMPSDSFEILGSCDGLVCLLDTSNATSWNDIFLWNSSTKEYKEIPMPPNFEHSTGEGLYGFGYDDSIDDFKLVRVAVIPDSDTSDDGSGSESGIWSTVEIYTLGSNSWRLCECQEMPYYFPRGMTPGVVVNGALHWCAVNRADEYNEAIISFDMTNEIFIEVVKLEGPMVHPVDSDSDTNGDSDLDTNDDSYLNNNDVGVLGGCLCILHKTYGVSVDVWVMQEYGVKESWTKRFTITHESITKTDILMVVCEFQNNEILFGTDKDLVCYGPTHNTAKKLWVDGAKMLCGAQKYVSTLASLGSGTYC